MRCGPSSDARSVSANGARFAGVRPHAERPNERRTTTRTASAAASEPQPSLDDTKGSLSYDALAFRCDSEPQKILACRDCRQG